MADSWNIPTVLKITWTRKPTNQSIKNIAHRYFKNERRIVHNKSTNTQEYIHITIYDRMSNLEAFIYSMFGN